MAVSTYSVFLSRFGSKITASSFLARAPKLAKAFKALPKTELAKLSAIAKKTPSHKSSKVRRSVLAAGVARQLPPSVIRKHWFTTKATTTVGRLNAIAVKAKLPIVSVERARIAAAEAKLKRQRLANRRAAAVKAAKLAKLAKKSK